MFDLQQAQALYARHQNKQPNDLEEWLEERIEQAVRDRDEQMFTTVEQIPSRFQDEDVRSAIYEFQDRGFDTLFDGHYIRISGWAD